MENGANMVEVDALKQSLINTTINIFKSQVLPLLPDRWVWVYSLPSSALPNLNLILDQWENLINLTSPCREHR